MNKYGDEINEPFLVNFSETSANQLMAFLRVLSCYFDFVFDLNCWAVVMIDCGDLFCRLTPMMFVEFVMLLVRLLILCGCHFWLFSRRTLVDLLQALRQHVLELLPPVFPDLVPSL